MEATEADQRIMLSRQTLHRYVQMIDGGIVPHTDSGIMRAETEALLMIAADHPDKAEKIASLIGQWRDLMEKLRTVH